MSFYCPQCQEEHEVGDRCHPPPREPSELAQVAGSQGEDQSHDLNVICPYCLYAYQAESEDYEERERKQICGKCDREYLLRDEISVTHYTRPIPENSRWSDGS